MDDWTQRSEPTSPDSSQGSTDAVTGPRPFDDPGAQRPVAPLLFIMLWLAPGRFFDFVGRKRAVVLTIIAAILAGMAGVVDRIDSQRVSAELMSTSGPSGLPQTWKAEWALIMIGGLFAAVFVYGIGGWWHRLRLRWCGVRNPDPILSRQVYIVSRLVFVLPMLALHAYSTVAFPTPDDAYRLSWVPLDVAVLAAVYWASFSNYRGLRVVFDARRGRAIFWFLVLPWSYYSLLVAVVAAAFFFSAQTPPSTLTPRPFRSEAWSFTHPAQWHILADDPNYNPDAYLRIAANQSGWIEFERYDSTSTPSEEIAITLEAFEEDLAPIRAQGEFTQWGSMDGVGVIATGEWGGAQLHLRVFATTLGDGMLLEVREAWFPTDEASVRPGFEMIRESFKPLATATSPTNAQPIAYEPTRFESASWAFERPSAWPIDVESENYDPDAYLFIEADPDGWFELFRYETTRSPEAELDLTEESYALDFGPMTTVSTFDTWAGIPGAGRVLAGSFEGEPIEIRAFVIDLENGTTLEIQEAFRAAAAEWVEPGLRMIRDSFDLKVGLRDPDAPLPLTDDAPY